MDFKGYSVAYDYTAKTEKEKRQKEKEVLNFIKMIESKQKALTDNSERDILGRG